MRVLHYKQQRWRHCNKVKQAHSSVTFWCKLATVHNILTGSLMEHWSMVHFSSEFLYPLSTCDDAQQLYKWFHPPEGVWFILSLTYQLHTGSVVSVITPPRCGNILLYFCMNLSSALNLMTIVTTAKKKNATSSRKKSSSPSQFLFPRFQQYSMFDKSGRRLYTVARLRLSSLLPTSTSVTQLAVCLWES